MATSQNGWPVNPPRSSRLVPGTSDVRVTVADGPAGDVLIHVLAQLHARVESLELDGTRGELDDWGYASRPIRGGTTTSNHASATAVDANAARHPLGARGTFTARQAGEIRQILAEVDNVVRWGGDYSGRADEMHFEINAGPAAVAQVAARIHAAQRPPEEDDDMANVELVHGDSDQRTPNGKWTWGDLVYLIEYSPAYPGGAGRRYVHGKIAARMIRKLGEPTEWPQPELDAVHTVPGGEVPKEIYQ